MTLHTNHVDLNMKVHEQKQEAYRPDSSAI